MKINFIVPVHNIEESQSIVTNIVDTQRGNEIQVTLLISGLSTSDELRVEKMKSLFTNKVQIFSFKQGVTDYEMYLKALKLNKMDFVYLVNDDTEPFVLEITEDYKDDHKLQLFSCPITKDEVESILNNFKDTFKLTVEEFDYLEAVIINNNFNYGISNIQEGFYTTVAEFACNVYVKDLLVKTKLYNTDEKFRNAIGSKIMYVS